MLPHKCTPSITTENNKNPNKSIEERKKEKKT
jgi:hypothetical protein